MGDTRDPAYARRLVDLEGRAWKRLLDVQAPYRRRLRATHPGRTLDVGCGIGRNLRSLSDGVGVDHNAEAVGFARDRGLRAWTTDEWPGSPDAFPESFDTLLLAHVLEHLSSESATEVVSSYLPYLRPHGQLVLVCPQERGYSSDETHVRFLDGAALASFASELGFAPVRSSSFPLPRFAGKVFTYNEFWLQARR